jgi:hypothetical protein
VAECAPGEEVVHVNDVSSFQVVATRDGTTGGGDADETRAVALFSTFPRTSQSRINKDPVYAATKSVRACRQGMRYRYAVAPTSLGAWKCQKAGDGRGPLIEGSGN